MDPSQAFFEYEFARIRAELGVPNAFPDEVTAAAAEAAGREATSEIGRGRADHRAVPFVTIDPAASRDLDQAFFAVRTATGYRVLYAIADLGFFVDRGGPVEAEAWRRGTTVYGPDKATPLYPSELSHGAASLLANVDRPAVVFTIELESDARARLVSVVRAVVRSRAKLNYAIVSAHIRAEALAHESGPLAGQPWSESLTLLSEIGRKRIALETDRGAVSLPISEQHVQRWRAALHGYRLAFRNPNDVEGWNAQVSIMTGILAAELMIRGGAGLLRALDPPQPDRVRALRLTAEALGVPGHDAEDYAAFIRSLDPTDPLHAAVIFHAAGAMGAARYVAFAGEPPASARHAAIADYYAHVTAPIRRLADRYLLDLLVAYSAGETPAASATEPLPLLPAVMDAAGRRAGALEREVVDLAEATTLADSVGREFEATVIRVRESSVTIQIAEPAVRTSLAADDFAVRPTLGDRVRVRLAAASPAERRVRFAPV
jgi:exoribonuclease R